MYMYVQYTHFIHALYCVIHVRTCTCTVHINFLSPYRISEYIPPRPALPRRIGGAEKAINDYHTVTADVASLLLADYRYSD